MATIPSLSVEELKQLKTQLEQEYNEYKSQNLALDMSRGKPAPSQLDLGNSMFDIKVNYMTEKGFDARNYGILDGIPEMKRIFSNLLHIPEEQMIIGGNSSLNLMYDTIARCFLFGTGGYTPWSKVEGIKFLCPSPGYDRHFAITEEFGVEMIPIPMTPEGPNMDIVEELVANDDKIKGMWCVPLFSNPQGICYSKETVHRLGKMKTAAKDFRLMWDNAYAIHHVYEKQKVEDILTVCDEYGNGDRPFYFFSTSKITFPGAGVSMFASSLNNVNEIKKRMSIQTIGHDKLNQLRTVQFFKDEQGVLAHMEKLADALRPKFDIVVDSLDKELGNTGLIEYTKPNGGYFVSVDVYKGCAKSVVQLAKEAGVVMTGAGATYPYGNDEQDRNIRIAPSYPTCEELQTAMKLFCLCVKLAGVNRLLEEKK